MAAQTQVNSATLIMGVTGSGKSSLLATLAKHVYRRFHKITLYYNSDGGGFPAEIQAVQALGILKVFRMYTRDPGDLGLSFETCYRACQGWWPKRINPASGEVEPGVEMVPPIMVRFQMSCPNGHLVKSVISEALLTPAACPTCKVMVQKQNMQVLKTITPNEGFENVGAVAYDGLSSMLAWGLRDLGHRAGRMELKGEEAAIGGKVISGELKFGGTTRSHVGFAQSRGEELVHLTLGIPNLVVPPIFTALTHEDVDERSLSIIGPKIAGRAKTDEAPQWFGNVLETAKIAALDGSPKEQRLLYLSEFTDPRGVRHLLKHRGSPGTMPAILADPPGGDDNPDLAFTQVNLGVFFDLLASALEKRIASVKEEFPDAPGLVDGIETVGGTTASLLPAAQELVGSGGLPNTLLPAPNGPHVPTSPVVPTVQPTVTLVKPRVRKPVPAWAAQPAVAAAPAAPAPSATVQPSLIEPVPAQRGGLAPPPGLRPTAAPAMRPPSGVAPRPAGVVPRPPAPKPAGT